MDFIRVAYKEDKTGTRQFYPALLAIESQDLVIRGGQFVAVWDESKGLYNRRLSHLAEIIDRSFAKMVGEKLRPGDSIKKVREYDNQIYSRLMGMIRNIGDMGPELDMKLVFADQTPNKMDAATFKMAYSLSQAPSPAWDELASTLYAPEERVKFEYAIGSILTGHSLYLQKFYVFFGPPGSGKSTIMNVIEDLFAGHTASFDAYEMGRLDSNFSLEPFKNNPLVALDQDADLSRLEVNTNLNKITAHDKLDINSKGKSLYSIIPRSTLFIGSNKPVKITDRKSGLYRRLVDIQPTGAHIEEPEYRRLVAAVKYELGSIAQHCINIFEQLGPAYLSSYRSTDMMYRTNDIFNFVQDNRLILQQGVTLKQAHKMWLEWCSETETRNVYKQFQFRDLLKDYFKEWHDQIMINGVRHRSYFLELRDLESFSWKGLTPKGPRSWLEFEVQPSILDNVLADMPAQRSTGNDAHPLKQAWDSVTTSLKDLDTSEEHYVKVPPQHIVVDIDGKDEHGNKSMERSLEVAAQFPPSYAEPSRGGNGIHIHFLYDGDTERLANGAEDGSFEVKTLNGGQSLRRKLTVCNNLPVATISSGLPIKEDKPVITAKTMASEVGLRKQIVRCLSKEIHPYTKPSMDMLKKVLDDAVNQGMVFDVTDMWDDILSFAMSSSNQKSQCIEVAMSLPLKSEAELEPDSDDVVEEAPITDFDLEVYPNLLAIGYMVDGSDKVVKLINPEPHVVEELILRHRLIGYYNRGYDNHILWAATLGWSNAEIYDLSQRIVVENDRRAGFVQAYNLAYGDLYDMLSEKKSLKLWEIELGLPHMEMDLPWNEPVPEDRMMDVLAYLENDVRSTRAVRLHRSGDVRAREILAELSGLEVCNTNRQHTEKLIFGDLKDTSGVLEYTDLSEMFPGYEFDRFAPGKDKSTYKGITVGEGGWVDSEPGMWENVAVLDVTSMHPTSIVQLNLFGKYTEKFKELMDRRLEAKRLAKTAPTEEERAYNLALSDALKIVINSVYGLTAASFPNRFKDDRNIDNIVAKRGALFMVDLKEFVEKAGFKVIHVKTDSIKIPNATPEIIAQVGEFGQKYGYNFEHEATYEKFVLLNDAVYVCREDGKWSATGKQYQHPVVFKTLFTKEPIEQKDYVEVKQVMKGAMYLVTPETEVQTFVGKFGAFVPVLNGRHLVRIDGDKQAAVAGTKDYLWELDYLIDFEDSVIDMSYFQHLVDDGIKNIEKFGSFEDFIS